MSRVRIVISVAVLVAGLSLLLVSCMGTEPEEPSYEDLLRDGRNALEENKGAVAHNYFLEANDRKPDKSEPMWGLVVSNGQRIIANLDGVVDILAGVYVYEPSLQECLEACDRLIECDLLESIRSSEETCLDECPWGLQPYMFEAITTSDNCAEVRKDALEWIVGTRPEDCVLICNDLEYCGVINPPRTYDLQQCYEHCPHMYVERHSSCHLRHLNECSKRADRTCYEHTIVGLQVLFREISSRMPPEILQYSDVLLQRPDDQYFLEKHSWSFREPPLTLTLDGRYGIPELHVYRMVARFMNAFVFLATATNLDINTVTFDLHFENIGSIFDSIDVILDDLIEVLEDIVYDPIFPGALELKTEDWVVPQIQLGGQELGLMFGEFAQYIWALMDDRDRQQGKALGYEDANMNLHWDPGEVLTFRDLRLDLGDLDIEFKIEYYQALDIAALCSALEANLLYEVPFHIDLVKNVLGGYDLWWLNLLIDLFLDDLLVDGMVDISPIFTDPQPEGARPLIISLAEALKQLQ